MDEQELFEKRITELAVQSYMRGIVMFSDFLDLNEQHILQSINPADHGVAVVTSGGYETAERRMAAFIPEDVTYEWSFPFVCLRIDPISEKFAGEMNHRDFLGSILSLGIDRSVLGDLIVRGKAAQVFVEERMADFLQKELTRVRRTPVRVVPVEEDADIFRPEEEQKTGSVASVRLDSVTALAFGLPRSQTNALIREGRVYVNAKLVTSNGFNLHEGDLISVRGHGKCRYDEAVHTTKKGRLMIRVSRFV
jgi:RNA-binding protein YlmH